VLAVEKRIEIQLVHRRGQPTADKNSRRKTQLTESKALSRSILKSTLGLFLIERVPAVPIKYRKLSCICRPLMKAL
jgi:hypothetical protein